LVQTQVVSRGLTIFVKKKKGLSLKAILLIDNAPSSQNKIVLNADDGLIFIQFLIPKTTFLIQPMDQVVILSIKQYYQMAF
jgi:hypothetical protein